MDLTSFHNSVYGGLNSILRLWWKGVMADPDSGCLTIEKSDLKAVPPSEHVIRFVERVLFGDGEALEVFYQAFEPEVALWVRLWSRQYYQPFDLVELDAADHCQDIMMRLIYGDRRKRGGAGEHESPLRQWLEHESGTRKSLYRFVQWNANFYLRDLRRLRRAQATSNPGSVDDDDPEDGLKIIGGLDHILDEAGRLQLRRCTEFCLNEMNPAIREVLESVRVMGYSQIETAQRLGFSEAKVSRWLKKGTDDIIECLKRACPEELLPLAAS